ncbi:MAG: hypothetical protein GTO00_08315 [Deltaproteobacteria bacterium]|nr:hypothetical protein [Deltaproteobacteria bacterium]
MIRGKMETAAAEAGTLCVPDSELSGDCIISSVFNKKVVTVAASEAAEGAHRTKVAGR